MIIIEVSAGKYHSMVLIRKRKIYTWGCGKHGRLGLGNEND